MPDWSSLGRYIAGERRARGLTRREFATQAGFSLRTLESLERASRDNYAPDTLAAVESVLMWSTGSVERVLAGEQPVPVRDKEWERLRRAWLRLPLEARRLLAALAEDALRRP